MKAKKHNDTISIEKLAQMTQKGFAEVDGKLVELRDELRGDILQSQIMTKRDLHETEERLLNAINGVEIKRPEFETVRNDVKDLNRRVGVLEKKR